MPDPDPTPTLRPATDRDRPAVEALMRASFDVTDAEGVTTILQDPRFGVEAFSVAEDAGEVVSATALLSMDLHVRHGQTEVAIPTGQPEYVATAPSHRGRGLVARQLARQHAVSEQRGDLVQIIGGIPYFYRRFGYGWGLSMNGSWRLASHDLAASDGTAVREATLADLPSLQRLHDQAQRAAHVWNVRTADEWRAYLEVCGRIDDWSMLVAERQGQVVGSAGFERRSDGGARVLEVAGDDVGAAHALVAASSERAGADVTVIDRPGTVLDAWARSNAVRAAEEIYAWYVRVPDPVALLQRLVPVLDARLADSPFASHSQDVRFSLYTSGFRLHLEDGRVVGVEPEAPDPDPGPEVIGIAPDLFPGVVFGRRGLALEQQLHPDVMLGRHVALAETLFPRQVADIRLWF